MVIEEKFFKKKRQRKNLKQRRSRKKKYKKQNNRFQNNIKETTYQRTVISEMDRGRNISYGECFWNNYRKVMNWNNIYSYNYWKLQANRLQLENRQLKSQINSLSPYKGYYEGQHENKTENRLSNEDNRYNWNFPNEHYRQHWKNYNRDTRQPDIDTNDDNTLKWRDDSGDYEMTHCSQDISTTELDEVEDSSDYEVTEEFMKFIQISMEHKQSMAKNNNKQKRRNRKTKSRGENKEEISLQGMTSNDSSGCEAPQTDNSLKRLGEMRELYGTDSAKIHGMETAVHLAFMRKCDKNKPTLWPVLPLRS